ncbi:hypothetical protein CYMTET_56028 [Cymbomonas tetramitiformis]|uniref:Uncharacterized protein n=1 Tax=Cymbomonas tetramitiformis TaxID=36881 RepID=A0AAE0EMS1_9CHLO|nr:hypothetical protein CYMTET_56028 [Cymbomonas tetramitiformis]
MRVETAKEADKAAGFDEEYDDEDVVQEDGVANEDEPDFICQRKTPQAQNELAKAQQDVLDLHLRIGHTLGQVTDANETEAAVKFHTLCMDSDDSSPYFSGGMAMLSSLLATP